MRLFEGCGGYGDGEQRRDFVSVEDVVAVNLWFLEHRDVSGIFNCGTGRAQTFNERRRGGDQRGAAARSEHRCTTIVRARA